MKVKDRTHKRKTIRDAGYTYHTGKEVTLEDMEYMAYLMGVGREIDSAILPFDEWKLIKDGFKG